MSGEWRFLPVRPSLRYLKLEAKHRLAAGEFPALYEAQLAIAREHGLPSWAALKHLITIRQHTAGHALTQLRWVASRFRDARMPTWEPPDAHELQEHFDEGFLRRIPPRELVATISGMAAGFSEELAVIADTPLIAWVQVAGVRVAGSAEAEPPHRLNGVRWFLVGTRVTDPRVAEPSTRGSGLVPEQATQTARAAFSELGLPGLVLAGSGGEDRWVAARGWANLERGEVLAPGHRFPVYGITKLITATAVLRLAAGGHLKVDDPVNGHLRTVRLADDAVTIRELLTHTGGADSPRPLFASSAPHLASLAGPVVACGGPRGVYRDSRGGYAVLGQLIADITGSSYADAAARLVLEPLGMTGSSFPPAWSDAGPGAVTGYDLAVDGDGAFTASPQEVSTLPAAGGLWATAPDLARFGAGWSSLLPRALAREALTPQAGRAPAGDVGLGWLLDPSGALAGEVGDGPGGSASLLVDVRDGRASVALANRSIPVEALNLRVLRAGG